jgi:6-phosphogluconolactonase (cycloisomerase 2 family)
VQPNLHALLVQLAKSITALRFPAWRHRALEPHTLSNMIRFLARKGGIYMRRRKSCCSVLLTVAIALAWLPAVLHAQFVYVTNEQSLNISAYKMNPTTGVLTPVSGSPFRTDAATAPVSVAVHPSGKFVYVASIDLVSAYEVNPTSGALTPVFGSPFPAGQEPFSVAVDPTGKFAYIPDIASNNVLAYTIDPTTGELTPVSGSPFPAGTGPRSVAVDPTSGFAYVTNAPFLPSAGNVSGYTINPTSGALTPVSGSPFPAGAEPDSVAVDPGGKFVYVANVSSSDVSGYTINPTTGALTPMSGSPFSSKSPVSVAVDPSGKFVYVANNDFPYIGTVSAYEVNPTTGALTPVSGSPFPAGTNPRSVAVDPGGKFVYVANILSNNVSGYTINPTTGALTTISGSPFPAGTRPNSVAIAGCVTRPTITGVSASPATLWPPNHDLIDVSINYTVAAPCGEPPTCTLRVASNEPVNNDQTSPDWVVLDAYHVELRAERSGAGTGRIYTITIGCTDTRGSSATQKTTVSVPHDQAH